MNKDTFKAMTGIEVKAMPKPRRSVKKVTARWLGEKKPEKATPGYTVVPVVHKEMGIVTYYEVKTETAERMDEKGVGILNENGQVKDEQRLYLDLNIDGYKDADAATRFMLLEDNKDDFVNQFGEGAYWAQQYGSVMQMPFSGNEAMDDVKALSEFAKVSQDYITEHGEEQFRQTLAVLIDAAFYEVTVVNDSMNKGNTYKLSILMELIPEVMELYQYTDSEADKFRQKNGIVPEAFSWDDAVTKMDLPEWHRQPEVWDEGSIAKLLDTRNEHAYWTEVLGTDYQVIWADRFPTREEVIEKGKESAEKDIADEHAFMLGVYAFKEELLEKSGNPKSAAPDIKTENEKIGYEWNPVDGVKNAWVNDENRLIIDNNMGLDIAAYKSIIEYANDAMQNILIKKHANLEVTDEDYAVLRVFGMTDIIGYLNGIEQVAYEELSDSSRDTLKQAVIAEGHYAYYDFAEDELTFLKNATVDEIDKRITEESAKSEPDEQMLGALSLYRYYKDDLGIEVTGDYEVDRTAAKQALVGHINDLTGEDDFQQILVMNAAMQEPSSNGYENKIPIEWERTNQILTDAPPELFMNTEAETEGTYETGSFIAGLRNGFTLGLARLQKENVANPEEFKRLAMIGNQVGGTEFYKTGVSTTRP